MAYTVRMAMVNFRRSWKLHGVMAVCLALGMLFPLLCLGKLNVSFRGLSTIGLRDWNHTTVAVFRNGRVAPAEVAYSLEQNGVELDAFGASVYAACSVNRGDVSQQCFVYAVTDNFFDFKSVKLVEGKLDIFSARGLCLVDESMKEIFEGLAVGKNITISGIPYQIAGIITAWPAKALIIPYSGVESQSGWTLDEAYLHSRDALPEEDSVMAALEAVSLSGFEIREGGQYCKEHLHSFLKFLAQDILVALFAFCFAALNISMILTGKLMQDKRAIGIQMALGVTPGMTLLTILLENLLCCCIAFLLDFGLVWLVFPTRPKELRLSMDAAVYLLSFLFGGVMVLILTMCSTRWLKKQSLATLIERVS